MTTLISFPFRLTAAGPVASRDDFDDDYLAEELAQLIQTRPGERVLVPTYGLNDPAYADFDEAMLVAQVGMFGPPVTIEEVEITDLDDEVQDVVVHFSPVDSEEFSGEGEDEDEDAEDYEVEASEFFGEDEF